MFVFGCLLAVPSTSFAYRTLTEDEPDVRGEIGWPAAATVSFDADSGRLTEGEERLFETEFAAAIATWNAVECAPPRLASGPPPAVIRVSLVMDWAERGFEAEAAGTTDVSLELLPDGTARITGALIYLNGALEWGAHPQPVVDGLYDIRAVLVHELGHALGLAHVCGADTPVACEAVHEEATMFPRYRGGSQATLADDDIAGLCAIYGGRGAVDPTRAEEASRCDDDAECALGRWCIERRCERDMRFGEVCESETDCIGARCVAHGEAGVCTYLCDRDEECPGQTRCVGARSGSAVERVCAPSAGGSAGCSATGSGDTDAPLWIVGWLTGLWLLLRVRRRALVPGLAAGALALVAGGMLGCGGEPDPADAGRADSGGVDAATTDAGPFDAGAFDAGPSGGTDAGFDGGFDAGPELCSMPGETRVGACGFCGMQSQTCSTAGFWEGTSTCLGEGVCSAGTSETESLAMCGVRERICLATCAWSPWEDTTPVGACSPGEMRLAEEGCPAGLVRAETCTASCAWMETRACEDPCGGTARTAPDYASEVCVPAGSFVRGSDLAVDTQPVAEVFVSAFYIDRYPVTNRRFRACQDAGVCSPSGWTSTNLGRSSYNDSTRADYPIQNIFRLEAEQFCMWDGVRRLPTEAEWEKALRGPAPRANIYPWEGDAYRCDLVADEVCDEPFPSSGGFAQDAYNGLPGSRGYYGTFLQYGGTHEWVSDGYSATYYAEPGSLSDPTGPTTSASGLVRGGPRGPPGIFPSLFRVRRQLTTRTSSNVRGDDLGQMTGIRCARSAP